jgi:hypothetical protein
MSLNIHSNRHDFDHPAYFYKTEVFYKQIIICFWKSASKSSKSLKLRKFLSFIHDQHNQLIWSESIEPFDQNRTYIEILVEKSKIEFLRNQYDHHTEVCGGHNNSISRECPAIELKSQSKIVLIKSEQQF